ncbi:MAG: hypothetical protein UY50_C0009G0013 [Parcubacteria group bacterium GW2011_GWA2_49_9]|nr:MAG: hypothetical protein UY50_C0009G0013 [Parcubacteria group bacterium GW2011_GWA2_49_9]
MTAKDLNDRINNFWGYGSLESPTWLVGMEEGFCVTSDTAADRKMLERQFLLPTANGMFDASRPIDKDICDLTNLSPFLPNAKLQRTWEFPITLYMFLRKGKVSHGDEVVDFQRSTLADGKKNEVATLELMPLPSPSTSAWLYGDIQGFETRKSYLKAYKRARAHGLRELVEKYSPKLVIFYSVGYLRDWEVVNGKMFEEVMHQMYFSKTEKTSLCVIPQPRYLPRAYERLYEYAEKIKGRIDFPDSLRI